jgi:hypothetical protein
VKHRCARWALIGTLAFVLAWVTGAATLRLGPPVIQQNQYTFPVYLQGDTAQVAALDFRLSYDPAVFSPVAAQSGPSAASAQKQVSSNLAAPGEFVVVMMGFNQNSVAPGEVMQIVMEKIQEPAEGTSVLRIDEPEIASRGLARTVRFGERKDEEDDSPDDAADAEDTGSEEGESAGTPDPAPSTGRTPRRGLLPFVVADGAAGPGESTNGGHASAPTSNARSVISSTVGAGAQPAADPALPPGTSRPPGEAGRIPGNAASAGSGAGSVPPAGTVSGSPDALTETPPSIELTAASEENEKSSGNFPSSYIILSLGIALVPLVAVLIYKILAART